MNSIQQIISRTRGWLWIIGGLVALAGYFGPWINHPAGGLVITGLDLGEYVKFLPQIRNGELVLWREGFYLPLVAISITFSLHVFRNQWRYHWLIRAILIAGAIIAALNMLPPAWTPDRMMTAEFRWQASAIAICLVIMAFSPFLALLPITLSAICTGILTLSALWFPMNNFLQIIDPISQLYSQPQSPGWGFYMMGVGLMIFVFASLVELIPFFTNHAKGKAIPQK